MSATVDELPAVYLHPGQIYASAEPSVVRTILGSCVAVCLFDAVACVGGMNHFLLPTRHAANGSDLRYGNLATDRLIDLVIARGAEVTRLEAKLFGGATMVPTFGGGARLLSRQNVAVAREVLASHGIPVVAESVDGRRGRNLFFETHTGAAFVKEIV
jgi:chemotaxis protein CheD